MAANGQLVFTDVDKVTFKGVGNTSNAVIDTITGKLGVGVDSPDANLHIIGNCFVSTDLTASTLSGNGSGLTALNATNITTGTLDAARIPVLDAAKITSGTFAQARIPLLSGVTGVFDPNVDDIKIGNGAGTTSQGSNSVAVGHDAGKTSQGTQAVAVGYLAGNGTQGDNAVAVGIQAGSTGQGDNAIAVGRQTGVTSQGDNAVAVGYLAGNDTQGTSAVAVGIQAGQSDQGDDAIAIGHYSGQTNQGNKAVAVGYAAGLTDQHANSIILNASDVTLDSGGASRFYVKPIRAATEASNVVTYNATTGEVLDCKGITVNTLGHVTAIKILGDGSGLTALSALNVTTGLLDTLRIPDLPASKITSGTLPVTRGGTGTTTSTGTGSVVLSAAPAFTGDVTFDTDTLKIDSTNNRVGIGTTSPTTALEISRAFTANDDTSAMISFTNSVTGYHEWRIGPTIYSGSAGFAIKGGADGFGNLSDVIAIRGTNVGIGNRNPLSKLDLFDTGGCTLRLTTDNATPQGTIDIIRGDNSRSPSDYTFGASNYYDWRIGSDDTTSSNFAIRRKGDGLDTKVLVINGGTGNVGIGTTSPGAKLDIKGDIKISGSTSGGYHLSTNSTGATLDFTHGSYSWGRWANAHHYDVYSVDDFTGSRNLYLNYYSGAAVLLAGSAVVSSDDRIKTNERYITNATETLLKLKPQIYDKGPSLGGGMGGTRVESGLIVQDIYYDAPELRHLVHYDDDAEIPDEKPYVDDDPQKDPDYSMWGTKSAGLNYEGFIAYLIKSNQELHARIQTLENA